MTEAENIAVISLRWTAAKPECQIEIVWFSNGPLPADHPGLDKIGFLSYILIAVLNEGPPWTEEQEAERRMRVVGVEREEKIASSVPIGSQVPDFDENAWNGGVPSGSSSVPKRFHLGAIGSVSARMDRDWRGGRATGI